MAGDLLLVAGLHRGAAGAALATVISQTLSVLISFLVLRKRSFPFAFTRRDLRIRWPILRRMIRFGTPIALQDLLVGLSFLVILAIVNSLGLTASAGVGVAEKVCAFIMLLPLAFMQSMSAYVAQNHGAGENQRALRGLRIAILASSAFGVLMFFAAFFRGDLLCGIFARDAAVVAAGTETGFVMLQGIAAAFLIRIPVAWWMSRTSGRLFFIGLGVPLSTVAQILACFGYLAWLKKRERG